MKRMYLKKQDTERLRTAGADERRIPGPAETASGDGSVSGAAATAPAASGTHGSPAAPAPTSNSAAPTSSNERRLIESARGGSADAFCRLYESYQAQLYRYAFYRLGSEPDAEDAVAECVLCAWRQIGSLREPDAFRAWIFRILSGCCNRLIKQQIRRREQISLDDPNAKAGPPAIPASTRDSSTLSSFEENTDTRLILQDALSQLPPEDRELILLSAVAGLKSHELASLTGMTAGSVRSRLSRSLKKVRGYLE